MLSGETAKGNYPCEAVKMMSETCLLAEVAIPHFNVFDELRNLAPRPTETSESVAMAAVSASLELNAGAIIVLTTRYVPERHFVVLDDDHTNESIVVKPLAWCRSTVPSAPS